MTTWDEAFTSHGLFGALSDARSRLDLAEKEVQTVEQREAHARVARILDLLQSALDAADPELVRVAVLDDLETHVAQTATYLQNFFDQPEQPDYLLLNASNQLDGVLAQLPGLLPRMSPGDIAEVQAAVTSYRRSAGQYLRNVEHDAKGVQNQVETIASQASEQGAKITAQDERLDAVVTEYQQQFSVAQDQRQADFTLSLEDLRKQVADAVGQSKEATDTAVADAETALSTLLDETKTSADEALSSYKQAADTQAEGFATQAKDKLSDLDVLLQKAVKTVGVIGSTGMAGGYKLVADDEKKAANIWRRWAAVALLGAIGATIFAVAHGVVHGFDAETFFSKWAVSIPFLALAGYAARESSKHRDQAGINRQIELQLASLDAYLVTLPEPDQHRLRAKLADRFFGQVDLTHGEVPTGESIPPAEER